MATDKCVERTNMGFPLGIKPTKKSTKGFKQGTLLKQLSPKAEKLELTLAGFFVELLVVLIFQLTKEEYLVLVTNIVLMFIKKMVINTVLTANKLAESNFPLELKLRGFHSPVRFS